MSTVTAYREHVKSCKMAALNAFDRHSVDVTRACEVGAAAFVEGVQGYDDTMHLANLAKLVFKGVQTKEGFLRQLDGF